MRFDYQERMNTPIEDVPIGRLLDSLRMESAFFTQSSLSTPWAMEIPPISNCMMFHLVVSGSADFEVEGIKLTLCAGDFVMFPSGEGHKLSDGSCVRFTALADLPIKAVTERFETLTYGGDGETSQLICGAILFQHPLVLKLLGVLPQCICIRQAPSAEFTMVKSVGELLGREALEIGVGAEAIISRLADILVIAAMRQHLNSVAPEHLSWLGALNDDRIAKSLDLIHGAPDKHWSLDDLASEVGMSRTSFIQLFKRLVGNTPIDYLTEWRMSLAYSKLQLSKESILTISLDVGYQSEAAFSRAFKKVIGKSPGEVRKAYQANN